MSAPWESNRMDTILKEIDRALALELHYLAVVMSLTLPDICAALESSDGRTSQTKFMAWYDKHLSTKFRFMSAGDCYSLRCGVVHQGRFGLPGKQFGRVIFTLPNVQGIVIGQGIINDALQFNAVQFCKTMTGAVRDWFAVATHDSIVQANLPNLVQLRPMGIAPYIGGAPVIA
jgi:hypothetical protein